jgi:preprotein translocase subunit SecF
MEFFKNITHIHFMRARKVAMAFSCILFLISIVALSTKGLNFGLDFTGGLQLEVLYKEAADLNQIRKQLQSAGFGEQQVKTYGASNDVMITLPLKKEKDPQQKVREEVARVLVGGEIQQVSFIGPQVGQELASKGALAMLIAMVLILIYIAWRFEYRLAISAVIALIHDPMLILGVFSLFQIEFDLISLAAVLTVIGYSLNDTIVVFDRVRENFRKMRQGDSFEIMDASINQTLSRTIMTSGLTLLAVISLLVFGGPTLFGFALALLIGIVVGTYSSIYIAGALAVMMGLSRTDFLPKPKIAADERP